MDEELGSDQALKSSHSKRWPQVLFSFLLGFIVFLVLISGAIFGYKEWLDGRVMHNVTYAGTSVSLQNPTDLISTINTKNAELTNSQITVTFQGKSASAPLSAFSPEFDIDATVSNVPPAESFESQPWQWLKSFATTLWRGKDMQPVVTLHQIPTQISDLTTAATVAGKDAQFQINPAGELTILPESNGTGLDAGKLLSDIEQNVISSSPIEATLTSVSPKTTSATLTPVFLPMSRLIAAPITLTYNKNTFVFAPVDLLNAIQLQQNNGAWQVALQKSALQTKFDSIEKSVDVAAKPKQVNANSDEVLSEGQAGISFDQDATLTALTVALSNRLTTNGASNSVQLVTKVVAPTEQKIQPQTTPGLYPGKYIEVDLSSQTLYQYEGDNLIGTYGVSTGKWSTPTPVGTYTIQNKMLRAYSESFGLYMPFWMGFIGTTYGIHELPEWPDGHKEGEGHIGTPVSHGCIRLGVGDAETMYNWAEVGTPVVVHK